jgi:hypothetical protein
MKNISIVVLLFVGILTSCEGDIGPQGPPGYDGFDGADGADGLIGSIFEVEADFTPDSYEFFVDIPASIEVYDTDVVMAYILSGVDNDVDIWEPLPQTLFFGNEILLYGYDYTFFDVRFFLDGTINLNSLDPLYTDNIIFRIAVIPADFAESVNTLNFDEVMGAMNVESVERIH